VNLSPRSLLAALSGLVWLWANPTVRADTIQTVGAGSAVSVADYSAQFNLFTSTGDDLSVYNEDGLSITTIGLDYYTFDPFGGAVYGSPFFYPANGTPGNWITIETDDWAVMAGVEFLYGNGWANGTYDADGYPLFGSDTAELQWQTLNHGVVDSSGSVVLNVGTIVGFSDPTGFDELQVSATSGAGPAPGTNALALDNLVVQLAPPPVSDGDWGLTSCLAVVLAGLGVWHHRRPPVGHLAAAAR